MFSAIFSILCCAAASAGETGAVKPKKKDLTSRPEVAASVRHDTSPPLRDLALPVDRSLGGDARGRLRIPHHGVPPALAAAPKTFVEPGSNPAVQGTPAPGAAPASRLSVEGFRDADNAASLGARVLPADPAGDVGVDVYVQAANAGWLILDKATGEVVGGPFAGRSHWAGFGGVCETNAGGNPRVLFDHVAGRWIFSRTAGLFPAALCFAVSASEDPMGPYHRYEFSWDGSIDGPSLGLWVTDSRQGAADRSAFLMAAGGLRDGVRSVSLAAFDRRAMLAGEEAAMVRFGAGPAAGSLLGAVPAHLGGDVLPPAGACGFFVQPWDDRVLGSGQGPDGYRFWTLCPDFEVPRKSSLAGPVFADAGVSWDSELCGFAPCLEQPEGEQWLDAASHLPSRAQLRGFGDDGGAAVFRAVIDHAADAGAERAGVHWTRFDVSCLLDRSACVDLPAVEVIGSSTWAPDRDHRAFAAIAQDRRGNVALGYMAVGPSTYPSLRYSVQEEDRAGTGLVEEGTCAPGGGALAGGEDGRHRVSMSVDPVDGCTFWMTGEYLAAPGSPGWQTRICSFAVPGCLAPCEELSALEVGIVQATFPAAPGSADGEWCVYEDLEATVSVGPFELIAAGLSFRKKPGLEEYEDIAVSWSGSVEADIPLGGTSGSLRLTRLAIEGDADDLEVTDAEGELTLGAAPDVVRLQISALDGRLKLAGAGRLSTRIGSIPATLTFDDLEMTYDFEDLTVTSAAGEGTLGDPRGDRVRLILEFEEGLLRIAGSGRITASTGTLALELTVSDFRATYDFADFAVAGFEGTATLKKTGAAIAEARLSWDGAVIAGRFEAKGNPTYRAQGWTIEVKTFDLHAIYDLGAGEIRLVDGAAQLVLSGIRGVKGRVSLSVSVRRGMIAARVDGRQSSMEAFGMTFRDLDLQADFDASLELSRIVGRLTARHRSIKGDLTVKTFEIVDGELRQLRLHGNVKFEGFDFTLTDGRYEGGGLEISGKVAVEEVGQVEVERFAIDEEGGVTIGSIEAQIQRNPVDVKFTAEFLERRFIGSLEGSFTTVGIKGCIDIGSNGPEDDLWTHVNGSLELRSTSGVTLGATGLKLTRLGGGFGFNYRPRPPPSEPCQGDPERGTHLVGLSLGIADVAGLFEIGGAATVQFGPDILILLEGSLAVPARDPVLKGELAVRYTFPEALVEGSLRTTIQIPSKSGSVVDIDDQAIFFKFRGDSWAVTGQDLEGKILGSIELSKGKVDLKDSGAGFTGELGGEIDFRARGSKKLIRIRSCRSRKSYGLELNYTIGVGGGMEIRVDPEGVSGRFSARAGGNARVRYKIPLFTSCGKGEVSASGRLSVELGRELCISGRLSYSPRISSRIQNTFNTGRLCL